MAFHGLRWVPNTNDEVNLSEMNAVQRMELACQIRQDGFDSIISTLTLLNQAYAERYTQVLQLQQDVQQHEVQLANSAAKMTQAEVERATAVAYSWKEKSSSPQDYDQDMNETVLNFAQAQFRFLQLADLYKIEQATLWEMNERLAILKSSGELWKFDIDNANKHKERLIESTKEEKLREAQIQKVAKLYLKHLKRQMKLARHQMIPSSTMQSPDLPDNDQGGDVLSRLDQLLITCSKPTKG